MDGIGSKLRSVRVTRQLTLREVEERTSRLAQQWGNSAYRISASWLARVENENGGLSAMKLIVLAAVYDLSAQQLLGLYPSVTSNLADVDEVATPNSTLLLSDGRLGEHAKEWLPDTLVSNPPPEDTTLLPSSSSSLPDHYRRGIIGQRDRTMEPMVPPGSIVLIDIQKRAIARRKDWNNEFDRPIYFLVTRTGYVSGFCELDRNSEWLTLIPHLLSHESSRRWRYKKEIEVIGTVTAVFSRRTA
jgi:transcriptional regulator with XRE-family HTH domain